MASRSIRQTVAILAAVTGALETILNEELVSSPEVTTMVKEARAAAVQATRAYPGLEDAVQAQKDQQWVLERMQPWALAISRIPMEFSLMVLIATAYQGVVDVVERVHDQKKQALLLPLLEAVKKLSDWCDPAGNRFEVYAEADRVLSALYKEIEF